MTIVKRLVVKACTYSNETSSVLLLLGTISASIFHSIKFEVIFYFISLVLFGVRVKGMTNMWPSDPTRNCNFVDGEKPFLKFVNNS